MEHKTSTTQSDLEQILLSETAEPKALPLSLLEDITNGFSDDQEIGRGGFAVVYKGTLCNRAVAVKRMSNALMDETKFHREVECLMQVKHKNVVRFLGYCADRQGNMARYNGKLVMADVHQRLLCFEYIPKGGLDKYISNANREWGTCYKIIKAICEGLQYLHDNHIIHLDLKPANILLDDNMEPKIADFGLSRCFDENQSRDITKTILGTMGYLAPEVREGGVIARSADLYSLGVIILEILTGQKGYQDIGEVLRSWSDRLERSQRDTLCEQIQVCYETALECRDFNPKKRPASARDIIGRLHKMEGIQTAEVASSTSGMVAIESKGKKSSTDDSRVCRLVPAPWRDGHLLAMPQPAGDDPVAYGLEEMKLRLPTKADEKGWSSEAHSLSREGLTNDTRYNVYYSPKLMYLKVVAISAQDLVPAEEGRSLAPTIVKIQMGGQIRRTKQGQPQGSANPTWNDDFMLVVTEPLEDPLVVTVVERISASREEPIGHVIIPAASLYMPRNDQAESVPPKWFSLLVDEAAADVMKGSNNRESSKMLASKIQLHLSLETEYHLLT
nr:Rmg8 protein splicing variant 1 [Triticum aestivum]